MANYTMTIQEMINDKLINGIFPKNYLFYTDDDKAKKAFEEKFINYYLYREIGFASPFVFKQKLASLLMVRMPYWKQLYETELEARNINFLLNKDLKETFIREIESENETSGTSTNQQNSTSSNSISQSDTSSTTNNTSQNVTSTNTHKESSINDGVAMVSLSDGYLTGASSDNGTTSDTTTTTATGENSVTGSGSSEDNIKSKGEMSQSGNEKTTEKTELISQGNIGITSSAQLLKEWREVSINMDEIIIRECNQLFMRLY